jgi:predicted RNase H-like HicB family nuclease
MKEISVTIELSEQGLYYGTSYELPGLLVATKTLPDMEQAIPRAIIELHAAKGQNIGVTKSNKTVIRYKLTGEGL